METLKKFEEINLPDRRNKYYVIINRESGEKRNLELKDFYFEIESIKINDEAPEQIRSQFNIARNLAIYTWFCYPFHQISEMKAFSTVDYALK